MNRLRKIIGQTVISLLGQGVTWTSTIILTIAYGRFLGADKFGELYLAVNFVGLIGFPIDAGFNQQLTRDVAQEPSKALRYITNILCFKIILWVVLYGCILLISSLLGYSAEMQALTAICGITLLTSSITSLMSSSHYALEKVIFPVLGNILEKGLGALIGTILLYRGANVEVMALVLLGSSCVSMLWQSAWIIRLVGIPWTFDIPLARKLLQKSVPFILYGVLGVIYYRIDTVLLSFMASKDVIGWYGAAYRIFDTLVFLPSLVIGTIMYPIFSKLSAHSETELKTTVEKTLNFLLFCGVPISIGLIIAAPNVVGFLYHRSDFVNTIPAMQFLAPGLLFLYVNSVLTSVMICTGLEKKIPIMAAVALVFNLGLNLLLIPLYQHVGAALVTSLTELLLMMISFIFIPRYLWPTGSVIIGLKALLAALVMGLAVWFMREYTILAILPVAAIVYLSAATLLGTIPRSDVNALFSSIRHKKGRSKSATGQLGTDSEGEQFLTDEEMQQEQEFIFALGREMTQPLLPAFKFDMTQPLLPAYRDELTHPLLPTYKPALPAYKPALPAYKPSVPAYKPLLSAYKDEMQSRAKSEEPTVHLPTIAPVPMIEDEDATLVLKVVGPTRSRKRRDLSSSTKTGENNNQTIANGSLNKEQKKKQFL